MLDDQRLDGDYLLALTHWSSPLGWW